MHQAAAQATAAMLQPCYSKITAVKQQSMAVVSAVTAAVTLLSWLHSYGTLTFQASWDADRGPTSPEAQPAARAPQLAPLAHPPPPC